MATASKPRASRRGSSAGLSEVDLLAHAATSGVRSAAPIAARHWLWRATSPQFGQRRKIADGGKIHCTHRNVQVLREVGLQFLDRRAGGNHHAGHRDEAVLAVEIVQRALQFQHHALEQLLPAIRIGVGQLFADTSMRRTA